MVDSALCPTHLGVEMVPQVIFVSWHPNKIDQVSPLLHSRQAAKHEVVRKQNPF